MRHDGSPWPDALGCVTSDGTGSPFPVAGGGLFDCFGSRRLRGLCGLLRVRLQFPSPPGEKAVPGAASFPAPQLWVQGPSAIDHRASSGAAVGMRTPRPAPCRRRGPSSRRRLEGRHRRKPA